MRVLLHMGVRLMLLIVCVACAMPASAQQWSVSAQAGRMRSTLDPAAASSSVALGLRYESLASGFRLSTGVPTSSVESLWAGVSGWTRAALRRSGFVAGVDVAGNAFITRDRTEQPPRDLPGPFDPPLQPGADFSGHAFAAQALPVLGFEATRFQIHARAGVSRYQAQFGGIEAERNVRLADLQLTLLPTSSFAVMPVARWYEGDNEEGIGYAGVSAVFARHFGSVWGSIGRWLEDETGAAPWAAGATVRVHPRVSLESSVRRDTFDPLYMQPPQTAWNVGLSVQIGGPVGSPAAPVPAAYVDGRATIRLPVSESATAPAIAGDFNGWTPVPMQRSGDHWTYSVALEPGVYNYSFVSADGTWFVPESVPGRRDDGMGGHVAVLVVQ